MSKTLKIFLYSLIGALVGVIGFGAISSVTRGEDKKEETVAEATFETFQDSTKYKEIAAKEGDAVANRWIRIYDGSTMWIDGIFNDEGAGFTFNSNDTEYIGQFHGAEARVDFEYRSYETYVDFYLSEGDIKFSSPAGDDTLYLSKNNIISQLTGNDVYFLITN